MKKAVKILISGLLAAALTSGAGLSAAACPDIPEQKTVSLSRIDDSTEFNCFPNFGAEILVSFRSVKNRLVIDDDEVLVIPAGKKLVLNKGAHIKGTLYIEQGGYLAVRGGSLTDCGSIVCDGTISVGENAGLSISAGSHFIVTSLGTLKFSAEYPEISRFADYACFGELKYKYLDDKTADKILAEPVCAVSGMEEMTAISDDKALKDYISGMTDYFGSATLTGAGAEEFVSVMLDNGSCVKIKQAGGKTTYIDNVFISGLKELAAQVLQGAAENKK